MKIKTLIKRLQEISEEKGNVEVFLADSYISCNHQYGEIKNFSFFDNWYETGRGEKQGILMGQEDPSDYEPPRNIEVDEKD